MPAMIYTDDNKTDELEVHLQKMEERIRAEIAAEQLNAAKESKPFCLRCANEDLVKGLNEIRDNISDAIIQGTPVDKAVKVELKLDYRKYLNMRLVDTQPYVETKLVTTSRGEVAKAKIPTAYFEYYVCDRNHKPLKLEIDPVDYAKRHPESKTDVIYTELVEAATVKKK